MIAKLEIILIIMLAMPFGLTLGSYNSEIGLQSTGSSSHETSALEFVAKQVVVSVITPMGSLLVDCRHEDAKIQTSLLFTQALEKPFHDITKNDNIVQLGQVFVLNEVSLEDDGYYMCVRRDEKGRGKIVVEVFVMEEEMIYNSCFLKHAFEEQTIEYNQSIGVHTVQDNTVTSEPSVTEVTDNTANKDHMPEDLNPQNATRTQDVNESWTDGTPVDLKDQMQSKELGLSFSQEKDILNTLWSSSRYTLGLHITDFSVQHDIKPVVSVTKAATRQLTRLASSVSEQRQCRNTEADWVKSIEQYFLHYKSSIQEPLISPATDIPHHLNISDEDAMCMKSSSQATETRMPITNNTSSHVPSITENVLDQLTSLTSIASSHVSSIAHLVKEWVKSTSTALNGTNTTISSDTC